MKKPVYVIIRYDKEISDFKERISIVKVLFSLVEAEKEVSRLNKINGDETTEYFWQTSRLIQNG